MKLTQVLEHPTLRLDEKFVTRRAHLTGSQERLEPLGSFAEVRWLRRERPGSYPTKYFELASVDELGVRTPYIIESDEAESGTEEQRILDKIERGDVGRPSVASVLLPRVRSALGKFTVSAGEKDEFFTREFLEVVPRDGAVHYLYFLLKHPSIISQLRRIAWVGKRYPTIYPYDLERFLEIPESLLDHSPQSEARMGEAYAKIQSLSKQLLPTRDVIDTALEASLEIAIHDTATAATREFSIQASSVGKSYDLRLSAHYHDPQHLKAMSAVNQLPTVPLSRLLRSPILLGISPEYSGIDTGLYYLSPAAMANGLLDRDEMLAITEDSWSVNNG